LHPFNRVPIFEHGDFTVYETSAIISYIDEAFEGPRLTPPGVRAREPVGQRRQFLLLPLHDLSRDP
jgi:glutathione S-transferase